MVEIIGLLELNRISRSPVAHLLVWIIVEGPHDGAHPKKAGESGVQNIDLHPFSWIPSPVRISSVADPYFHPT